MLPFPPPAGDGERVTLYHGTLESAVPSMLSGVDLRYAQANQDVGRGFYTTTLERQAVAWAYKSASKSATLTMPAVIAFEVGLSAQSKLDTLSFVRADFDAERYCDTWPAKARGKDARVRVQSSPPGVAPGDRSGYRLS
jgi:hypothetical protein